MPWCDGLIAVIIHSTMFIKQSHRGFYLSALLIKLGNKFEKLELSHGSVIPLQDVYPKQLTSELREINELFLFKKALIFFKKKYLAKNYLEEKKMYYRSQLQAAVRLSRVIAAAGASSFSSYHCIHG